MKRSWILVALVAFGLGALSVYWMQPSMSPAVAAAQSEPAATAAEQAEPPVPAATAEAASVAPAPAARPRRLVDRAPEAKPAEPEPQTAPAAAVTTAPPAVAETPARAVLNAEPAVQAEPPARTYTLETGSQLQVRTTNTISTKVASSGETFTASLEEPITDGDWVIAPKGATVFGKVVAVDPGGRVKGRARLTVELAELVTADGRRVAIRTNPYGVDAASGTKKDATKVGIGAGIGAIIGAIAGGGSGAAKGAGVGAGAATGMVLATHGEAAVIASESVLNFALAEPVTFTR